MSTPVEITIRTQLQANDAVQETIQWAEIVSRFETEPSLPPARPRLARWAVALIAALLVLLMVGGVAAVIQLGRETPAVNEPTPEVTLPTIVNPPEVTTVTTPPEPDTAEAAVPEPPPSDVPADIWAIIPINETLFPAASQVSLGPLGWGGPGVVMFGWIDGQVNVWTSPDGISWSRTEQDSQDFANAGISQVVAGGPGMVASGLVEVTDDNAVTALWTSPDGVTWSRVPHDEEIFRGRAAGVIPRIAAGPTGLVALGGGCYTGPCEQRTWIWTSTDGISWERLPDNQSSDKN